MEKAEGTRSDAQKKTLIAAERLHADVAEARRLWDEAKPKRDSRRLIFMDETWTKTNMTRLRGRAPRGQRLIGHAPWGHWKTTTFLAGLRHDQIVAPLVLDGPINGAAFRAYIQQFLAPTLRPGDIVIADNLSSHKVAGVAEAIIERVAEFLPVATLFAGPEPYRASIRKAESHAAKSSPAKPRGTLANHRNNRQQLRTK